MRALHLPNTFERAHKDGGPAGPGPQKSDAPLLFPHRADRYRSAAPAATVLASQALRRAWKSRLLDLHGLYLSALLSLESFFQRRALSARCPESDYFPVTYIT